MDFDALLAQVRQLLQRQGRVSYRALKLRFNLDDESLAALKDELIYAERVARDEEDRDQYRHLSADPGVFQLP
jgi:hypothetical protein